MNIRMKLKSDFNQVNDPILQREDKYVKNFKKLINFIKNRNQKNIKFKQIFLKIIILQQQSKM